MRGTPDIALLHGFALREQGALGKQLVHGADLALDRAVVDQHIGVFGPGVEILERDVDRSQIIAAVGQIGKNILAACHLDHLGDVIAALAHGSQIVGGNGEKRRRFAGGRLLFQRGDALYGIIKKLLGFVGLAQQHAVQLDPFHPRQRAALVARTLDQHRHAEFFQLFLDLGRVVDHRVFDGKAAVCRQNRFIIGRAVLARIGDLPAFHCRFGFVQIPVFGARAGKCHGIQPAQADDGVHRRGRDQINILNRLLQHGNVRIQRIRHRSPLGYDEIPRAVDGDKVIPARALVDGELLSVLQGVLPRDGQRFRLGVRWPGRTPGQQQRRQGCTQKPLHSAAASVALSKVRV